MKGHDKTTYERLMQSAAKLFSQKGFDGVTTRQIVADAGSSLSSLQAHFQSKESLYQAVIERTLETFYEINKPMLAEIHEAENQGFLTPSMSWNFIVQLTNQIVEWAFLEEYHNEIVLINREILMSADTGRKLPGSVFEIYLIYQRLIERYIGESDQFWIRALSFSIVTSAFDVANYPRALNYVLGCDSSLPENRSRIKMYMKGYLLNCIQSTAEIRKGQKAQETF